MIVQLPLKSSRVIWRHKSPNITTLLTNSVIPKERNYSSSHLCYNVYSSRIIDNETESCIKSCIGIDIGIIGPILVQRYDINENGIEILKLEKFCNNIDYYFKRVLLIPNILEDSIRDIKLHTAHDFHYNDNEIYIYVRSIKEISILRLYKSINEEESIINYEIICNSTIKEISKSKEENLSNLIDENTTIYSMVSSFYDYMEIALLLSNRVLLVLCFEQNKSYRFKLILNLNDIYHFQQEVLQCLIYGDNPNTFILGGKSIYLLRKNLFLQTTYIITRLYPCKDDKCDENNSLVYEEDQDSDLNTIKTMVSYTDRLIKLQGLRKKNISLLNITGITMHPIYSNILALIDSKNSKVVIIDIYQNSRIPLGEFSIPFTESIGNNTTRFRYIEWTFPKLMRRDEYKNVCRCGIVLYCPNYPSVIYSLLSIEYDRNRIDEFYKVDVIFVRELNMSKWDLEQDRKFYSPRKTQLLESSVDLLDNILNNYSIDDNFLSQYFHGFSGITVFAHNNQINVNNVRYYEYEEGSHLEHYRSENYFQNQLKNKDRMVFIPQSTSRHYIFEYCSNIDDEIDDCFIFLALNTCGRLTTTNIYILNDQDEESVNFNDFQVLNDAIPNYGLNDVYTCRDMNKSLIELYDCFQQVNNKSKDILKNRSRIMPPNIVEENYLNDQNGGSQYNHLNLELEVPNEQLTKRQYYNSKVYSGFDLLNLLLKDDNNNKIDNDEDQEILKSANVKLPLSITNGFDYIKEFKTIPGVLWSEESLLVNQDECVHIPSLEAQPFPLCSCRYFETSNSQEIEDLQLTDNYIEKKKPPFDIVGVTDYQYNYSLEEYLSFVPDDYEDHDGDNLDNIIVPKDILKSLSDHIFCLPLTPVSSKMAENYLKYHHYIGGKSDCSLKKKWKISQSCSRLNQPGCLLKYLIINEKEVENILNNEREESNLSENDESNEDRIDRDKLLQDSDFEVYIENSLEDKDIEDNLEEIDVERILNDDNNEDISDEDNNSENIHGNELPKRGIYIDKELLNILSKFWDESCEFYGLNSKEYTQDDVNINLLKDDLSQWYNYPYVSFETINANISDKEQLKLSLMSYVDTQLSNV